MPRTSLQRRDSATSTPPTVRQVLTSPTTLVPMLGAWLVVLLSAILHEPVFTAPFSVAPTVIAFVVVLAAIVTAAFGVVHQAEALAKILGDPYGTLVLTLSVVVVEVILISSVMLGPAESATIARDSLFAVMMIILNAVMGLACLLGGLRHGHQPYNRQGSASYLVMIIALALILPGLLGSSDGTLGTVQAIGLATISALLYAFFLFLQTTRHRDLYVEVETPGPAQTEPTTTTARPRAIIAVRSVLVLATVTPIVLLSHDLAILLDVGIEALGAPPVLSGILIAMIVFTPEAVTAVRAALSGEMQRTINLGLGAFVSTLGLTIPAVLVIGLLTGSSVVLAESPANMLLIGVTLVLSVVSFTSPRTNALLGAVHLAVFAMFVVTVFTP